MGTRVQRHAASVRGSRTSAQSFQVLALSPSPTAGCGADSQGRGREGESGIASSGAATEQRGRPPSPTTTATAVPGGHRHLRAAPSGIPRLSLQSPPLPPGQVQHRTALPSAHPTGWAAPMLSSGFVASVLSSARDGQL